MTDENPIAVKQRIARVMGYQDAENGMSKTENPFTVVESGSLRAEWYEGYARWEQDHGYMTSDPD